MVHSRYPTGTPLVLPKMVRTKGLSVVRVFKSIQVFDHISKKSRNERQRVSRERSDLNCKPSSIQMGCRPHGPTEWFKAT